MARVLTLQLSESEVVTLLGMVSTTAISIGRELIDPTLVAESKANLQTELNAVQALGQKVTTASSWSDAS